MTLQDFPLFTDQNIHVDVVIFLRSQGFDVLDSNEEGWGTESDNVLLQRALAQNRVVMTHDSDFGTLAIKNGEAYLGIVYLRPGHIVPELTIGTVVQLLQQNPELSPPFIVAAKRTANTVSIRVRQASP